MGVPVTYNIRNLIERKTTTLMTAIGIGLTVAVLITAIALTNGLRDVFAGAGDPRNVLVLRKGGDAELSSSVSVDSYEIIRRLPGIARASNDEPMVSPEGVTVVNLPSVDSADGMTVTVRGLLPIGLSMRSFKVTAGKMFTPGLRQVVVGESIARRYPTAKIGQKIRFGRGEWEVVGIFSASTAASNSEMWADLNQIRGDFDQMGGSSSLLLRTESPSAMKTLKQTITDDQRLACSVMTEKDYYANLTSAGLPLKVLGFSVAIIMAVGSAAAATNTMYAAVARRSREIATLRSIGFGRGAVMRSFLLESVFLALLGGVLGVLMTLPINGLTTGVGSFVTFSEFAFKFNVDAVAIAVGLTFAALIGAVGGFFPAWSAARKNIVSAMRDG